MANILKSGILVRIAKKDGSIDIGCVDSTPMKNGGADNLRKKFKGRNFTEDWKRKISENHADFSGEKHPRFGVKYI